MVFAVPVVGFEECPVSLRLESVFSTPQLFQDGRPAANGPSLGTYNLIHPGQAEPAVAGFKRHMLDPIPQVIVEGRVYRLAPPYRPAEWLWILAPVLIIMLDPIIGALFGAVAVSLNAKLMRLERPYWQRSLAALLTSGLAFGLCVTLVALIRSFILQQ